MPRIQFVSFTFLFAFGLGSFVGIALALLAVALARPEDETKVIEPAVVVASRTPTPTASATSVPTQTPTPVPVIRTASTLQVRIGPDEDYAILGTLNSGSEIDVRGRDSNGDWVAIEFPPGSSARGWIPADEVRGLSLLQIFSLDVLQASLIETTPSFPFQTSTPSVLDGNDGVPTQVAGTPTETNGTPSVTLGTPTPRPLEYGPTDLAFAGVSVNTDGSLRIFVDNLGPGDVPGVLVVVSADGFAPEQLTTGVLRAGGSTVLRTSSVMLTGATNVSITVDPNGELTDSNRSNNTRNATLSP